MDKDRDAIFFAETNISDIDEARGLISVCGQPLSNFAQNRRFEDCVELLWKDFFKDFPSGDQLQVALGAARVQVAPYTEEIDDQLLEVPPLEAVRTLIGRIPDRCDLTNALHLLAASAVFTGALVRMKLGRHVISPDPSIPHSADILRMINISTPDEIEVAALDAFLITSSDYGLTPPTLAARLAASTHAGGTSSVIAALSVFNGSEHDSKADGVLDILDAIGKPEHAQAWLEAALLENRTVGCKQHAYRKTADPRADIIAEALSNIENAKGPNHKSRTPLVHAYQEACLNLSEKHPSSCLFKSNNKLYSALLLEQLSFPREIFSCLLAMGRMAGWVAHSREQVHRPWLVRPELRYVGPNNNICG